MDEKQIKELELELKNLVNDITELTKNVVDDYKSNPSNISGSMIMFHEDSPYLNEGVISGSKSKTTDTYKTQKED